MASFMSVTLHGSKHKCPLSDGELELAYALAYSNYPKETPLNSDLGKMGKTLPSPKLPMYFCGLWTRKSGYHLLWNINFCLGE